MIKRVITRSAVSSARLKALHQELTASTPDSSGISSGLLGLAIELDGPCSCVSLVNHIRPASLEVEHPANQLDVYATLFVISGLN